jgi:hypothetical protein
MKSAATLVALPDDLAADGYRPGVIFAPVGGPRTLRELYGRARARGEAFLDPSGHLIDRPSSTRRAENFPWLDALYGRPTDVARWRDWMQISLGHQLSADLIGGSDEPSIVVTPSPLLTAATGAAELYTILDAANATRDEYDGLPALWLGLDIDRDFLRNPARLTEFANAVVTSGYPGVVLRCFQLELPPITDRRLIEGLRELVEGCAATDIGIALPGSGWLGWLASAWGATAWSGGISKSSWVNRIPTPMNNPGRRATIFEPQLLRHVQWDVHEELASTAEYKHCVCRSCQTMAGIHDAHEANIHQIRVAHVWSNETRGLNAHALRRRTREHVDEAIDFRDGLPLALRTRVEAGFLNTWRDFV